MATFEATNVLADDGLIIGSTTTGENAIVANTASININSDLSNGGTNADLYFETNLNDTQNGASYAWIESFIADDRAKADLTLQESGIYSGDAYDTIAKLTPTDLIMTASLTAIKEKVKISSAIKPNATSSVVLKSDFIDDYMPYNAGSVIDIHTSGVADDVPTTKQGIISYTSNLYYTNYNEITTTTHTDDSHLLTIRNAIDIGGVSPLIDNPLGSLTSSLIQDKNDDGTLNAETQLTPSQIGIFAPNIEDATVPFNTFKIETNLTSQKTFLGASDQAGNFFQFTDNNQLEMTNSTQSSFLRPSGLQTQTGNYASNLDATQLLFGKNGSIYFDDNNVGANIICNDGNINIQSTLLTFNSTSHLEKGKITVSSTVVSGTVSFAHSYPSGYVPSVVLTLASITSGYVGIAVNGLITGVGGVITGFNWVASANTAGLSINWISI